uniref:uncharacterized protein LOC120340473 isoform X1 n=1 Tax=Styela clava TaxID=7725 RepID=UPI00193ACF74|nr:uncharacterized protein LOC120340473 isoform X1 [Styela clava]
MGEDNSACLLLLPPNCGGEKSMEIMPIELLMETMIGMGCNEKESTSNSTQVNQYNIGNLVSVSCQVNLSKPAHDDGYPMYPSADAERLHLNNDNIRDNSNCGQQYQQRLTAVKEEIRFLESHLKKLKNLMVKVTRDPQPHVTEYALRYTDHVLQTAHQLLKRDLQDVMIEDKYIVEHKFAKHYLWHFVAEQKSKAPECHASLSRENTEVKNTNSFTAKHANDAKIHRFPKAKTTEINVTKRKRFVSMDDVMDCNGSTDESSDSDMPKKIKKQSVPSIHDYSRNKNVAPLGHYGISNESPDENLLRSPDLLYSSTADSYRYCRTPERSTKPGSPNDHNYKSPSYVESSNWDARSQYKKKRYRYKDSKRNYERSPEDWQTSNWQNSYSKTTYTRPDPRISKLMSENENGNKHSTPQRTERSQFNY